MFGFRSTTVLVLALASLIPLHALGSEDAPAPLAIAQQAEAGGGDASESLLSSLGGDPVVSENLDRQRGGAQTANDMELSGVVGNNHASDLITGNNIVTDGSLTGNAGFATVVQNSGNNVLIQNATIINLQLH